MDKRVWAIWDKYEQIVTDKNGDGLEVVHLHSFPAIAIEIFELVKGLMMEAITCPYCKGYGMVVTPVWNEFYNKYPADKPAPTLEQIEEHFGRRNVGPDGLVRNIPEEMQCDKCAGRGNYRRTRKDLLTEIDKIITGSNGCGKIAELTKITKQAEKGNSTGEK